jgi:hypothetical protein
VALDSTLSKPTAAPTAGKGASEQAIGVTKGGRNSKIHALVDKLCRPWAIILTPGNVADCTIGPECVSMIPGVKALIGDKAYDSNPFRKSLQQDGIIPCAGAEQGICCHRCHRRQRPPGARPQPAMRDLAQQAALDPGDGVGL